MNGRSSYETLILLERVRGELLGVGRDRENRLADEHGLVREDRVLRHREARHVVGREHAVHARHRKRRARVDTGYARVRQRAREKLAEHHAVDAEVLRVLRAARDFGFDVGRGEVLAEQLVGHRRAPRYTTMLLLPFRDRDPLRLTAAKVPRPEPRVVEDRREQGRRLVALANLLI